MTKSELINIENVIQSFESSHIWEFDKYVMNNKGLSQKERNIFGEIWRNAGEIKLWNFSDLTVGCTNSRNYIKNNYDLSEKSISKIVNALSYSWR